MRVPGRPPGSPRRDGGRKPPTGGHLQSQGGGSRRAKGGETITPPQAGRLSSPPLGVHAPREGDVVRINLYPRDCAETKTELKREWRSPIVPRALPSAP